MSIDLKDTFINILKESNDYQQLDNSVKSIIENAMDTDWEDVTVFPEALQRSIFALEDGAFLASEGYTDSDQEAIEDAHSYLTDRLNKLN